MTARDSVKRQRQLICSLCPRLVQFRRQSARAHPDWHNAPVPGFGDSKSAEILIVGLAPGLRGANRTGRPFTGDAAGRLLYRVLIQQGLARGVYGESPDDGMVLKNCLITNAVRCVPPENRPAAIEIKTCRRFLTKQIASMPRLRAIVALGRIAHDSTLDALDIPRKHHPFRHRARHRITREAGGLLLFDSYHCSQRNISTKILTPEDFAKVFTSLRRHLAA